MDIDTNGTGLFRVIYSATIGDKGSEGNRRKRKAKSTGSETAAVTVEVEGKELGIGRKEVILKALKPSQLTTWLERLKLLRTNA